ncbi:hypothetical protein K8Q94_03265 [Candidatus Nomurabacteria bacterium]|nr:hypothetical protein [Candidatus Nomurabacteria bacterium]
MSRKDSIKARQDALKEAFIEQLKRTPVIEQACQKVKLSRATIYRWVKEKKSFEKAMDAALEEGRNFMCDIAETQLFSLIGDKEFKAIALYLKTHSDRYGDTLEVKGLAEEEALTKEERKQIKAALKLSSIRNHVKKTQKRE